MKSKTIAKEARATLSMDRLLVLMEDTV
jgi:hypothetical protein